MNNLNKTIGLKIKSARREKGITQLTLAGITELTRGHISNIECGLTGISVEKLKSISKAVDKPMQYFVC